MNRNIYAWTDPSEPAPAFVSLNEREDGAFVLTVRDKDGTTVDVDLPREELGSLHDALRREILG